MSVQVLIRIIQGVFLTVAVILATYCFVTKAELFPFAPYSMYSQRHKIEGQLFFRFYCLTSKEELISDLMIRPFDIPRITLSVENDYLAGNKLKEITEKLISLERVVLTNDYKCQKIVLKVKNFSGPSDYLRDAGTTIDTFSSSVKE